MSNQRLEVDRAGEIRPGSKAISKVEEGSTGTQESLPPPYEKRLSRIDLRKNNPNESEEYLRL